MTLTELLLILLVLTLVLFFLRMSRQRKKNALYARLDFLRPAQEAEAGTSRIPWQELSKPEVRIAAAGVVVSLAVAFFFNLPVWSLVLLLCIVCPAAWFLVRRYRLRRFRAEFAERFPEAVDSLTRAVQAGVPLERALASIGAIFEGEMAHRFQHLVQQMEIGVSFKEALDAFAAGLDLPDVDYFCAVLVLHRETGSQITPMLLSLSRTLSERRVVARKLKALTAESRAAARVLSFLPLFIIGLQALLNPQQLQFLINDPLGRIVIGYCTLSMAAGILIIRRMSRLSD